MDNENKGIPPTYALENMRKINEIIEAYDNGTMPEKDAAHALGAVFLDPRRRRKDTGQADA